MLYKSFLSLCAGLHRIVGSISDYRSRGRKFQFQLGQWVFTDLDNEIISMIIFHLLLIQEGQLSVTDENMGSNTLEDYTCPGAGLCGSVRCVSDWWSGGCGSDPRQVWQHSLVEINHEIFSMVILSFSSTDLRRAVVSFWWKNVHV